MQYRAVGNRCAVNLDSLNLPISNDEAFKILFEKRFKILNVDIISLARGCIGSSKYQRGAKPSEAPAVLDCSSFIKWLYAMRGIWLPRRSIQQREMGEKIKLDEVQVGDVIFVSGFIDYFDKDPADGVGHVGIATGEGTVIHAADKKANVVESTLASFIGKTKLRGIRRYVPDSSHVLTLLTPSNREVETSDDIRWIVLQSLPIK